jgi:RNA polymerase sigma-32 factor
MRTPSRRFTAHSRDRDLYRYLHDIQQFPLVEAGEEFRLARRWREHRDSDAAHRLVTSHLRLVVRIAGGFRGYGLPLADLVAEGNIGMIRAVDGFDPDRGFRLATYAVWWIRALIQEYILRNWSLVRIGTTATQKKLFFKLRQAKDQIKAIEGGDLSADQVETIAQSLDVPVGDVIAMNRRLAGPDSSLDAPIKAGCDIRWLDWLADDSPSQEIQIAECEETSKRRQLLRQALATLGERERHILRRRQLTDEPYTLRVLGEVHGISPERVRQIEVKAYRKVAAAIRKAFDMSTGKAPNRGRTDPWIRFPPVREY